MSAPLELLECIQSASAVEAWQAIFDYAQKICSAPLSVGSASAEVTRRDRHLGAIDLLLSCAAYDLWREFEQSSERTAEALINWWSAQSQGRAVLILDALSLREIPWILQGATDRGFKIHSVKVTGAELPGDTTSFAKALGLPQRSALENNRAGQSYRLPGAHSDTVDLPWSDCANLIGSEPSWVLWHHWPDSRVHDLSVAGKGLDALTTEVATQLMSSDFWALIDRLATGRSVVITSDHGYAASGLFADVSNEEAQHLKALFKSGRWRDRLSEESPWVPPVALTLHSRNGENSFVLGRRKWKSSGGYPTLVHGGLSILEVACPFIELSK
jgi:hypothetical protein